MFLTLAQRLESFFQDHSLLLQKSYPGLSLHRLFQELEEFLHIERSEFDHYFGPSHVQNLEEKFSFFLEEIKRGVPLEYITKRKFFYRSLFYIDERVLIPRSETEILVEMAVKEIRELYKKGKTEDLPNYLPRIIDVGTGSGAIILSLLLDIDFPVWAQAIDISPEALKVARINAHSLQFTFHSETKLEFLQGDRFSPLKDCQGEIDLIVSNPPYIKKKADWEGVHPQVIQFEPSLALFINDDEYEDWYKTLFKEAFGLLKKGGVLLMEGHENHLKNLQDICESEGFSLVSIQEDYTKRSRFLKAIR